LDNVGRVGSAQAPSRHTASAFQPTLGALLAGILVGLGFAAGLAANAMDGGLYLDPRTRTVLRK